MNAHPDQAPEGAPAGRPARRFLPHEESAQASRHHWDADVDAYLGEHGAALGDADLLWCPEGLREASAHLLGDVAGARVLEVGCGAGQGGRWVAGQGARVVGVDISAGMLAAARSLDARTGISLPTVQADAVALPFLGAAFDVCFSAFGALPFVPEPARVLSEIARVLRPGGRVVCSVVHPVRWMFPDDGGPAGLVVTQSYFDRRAYVEEDKHGRPVYAEHHRTIGDWVQDWTSSGLVLDAMVEPEWVPGTPAWGAWTPERGARLPGTLILSGHRPE